MKRTPEPRPGSVDAPAIARLPKASPLVLPAQTPAAVESPPADDSPLRGPCLPSATGSPDEGRCADCEATSDKSRTLAFDDASLGRLALLLTTHFGPVAKVLVRRKAAESADAAAAH